MQWYSMLIRKKYMILILILIMYLITNLKAGTYYIALKPFNFYYSRSTSGYAINIHKTAKLNNLYNNRARHGMDNINGKLYVFGGVGSNYEVLSSIDVYDPDTRLWTQEDNNTENIKRMLHLLHRIINYILLADIVTEYITVM